MTTTTRCKNGYSNGIKIMRLLHSNFCPNCAIISCANSSSSTFVTSFDAPSHSKMTQEIRRRWEYSQRIQRSQKTSKDKHILSQLESVVAQHHLITDKERFSKIKEKMIHLTNKEESKASNEDRPIVLPLNAQENSSIFIQKNAESFAEETKSDENEDLSDIDRGFFVSGDYYYDDYLAATTADIPEDDMTEASIKFYGDVDDAVEDIEFQLPGQPTIPKSVENQKSDIGEWASNYGTTEATEEELAEIKQIKDIKCAGCGAQFHCQNSSLPGFVPLEMIKEIEKNSRKIPFYQRTDYICRRCYLLKEYNFLMNLNVTEVNYTKMMGHLKLIQEALILLIVDMTDLQCSIYRNLPKIIGSNKPMIVIGNKVDLLPPDTRPGYFRHYRNCLRNAVADAGISSNFNVLKYLMVSAKTGFGVEDLITNIYQNWIGPRGVLRNDIYVVGSTNAGKSTLFNTFIQSDLCKVRAMDLVERVTTSIWPGTTLSLLKFPLMNPTPQKLELRRRRLLSMQTWVKKEEQNRRSLFHKTKDPKYIVMQGLVGNTYKEIEEDLQPISTTKIIKQMNGELTPAEELEELEGGENKRMSLNDRVFQKGHWCYDTPGMVNRNQILDLLTLDELTNVLPRSIIIPRVFIIFPGQSLLMGGAIACIDIIDSSSINRERVPIYLTVFASQKLEANVMATKYVDDFIQKHRGDSSLGAPLGDNNRLEKFPKMEGIDFEIDGGRRMEDGGVADVVLSSIGWAMLTTNADKITIRASTPAGRGIFIRHPPMIPFAADYRDKRIKETAQYKTHSLNGIEAFWSIRNTSKKNGRIVGRNTSVDSISDESTKYVCFDMA